MALARVGAHMIREIPAHLVPEFWPLVDTMFEKALKHHPHLDINGLQHILLAGRADLILVIEDTILGGIVMESVRYPSEMVGNIVAAAGDVGSLATHGERIEKYLEDWCLTRNLSTISMLGRAGWSAFLSRHGWQTQPSLVAWKELRPHVLRN